MMAAASPKSLTGKHIILYFVAFFGVVFCVNMYFLYAALSTGPGEEVGASYEAGRLYNATLSQERAQNALGWAHKLELVKGNRVRLLMTARDGSPLTRLTIASASIGRPATTAEDRALEFREIGQGIYEADVKPLNAGSWVLLATAHKGSGATDAAIYRIKERLWYSPAH